MPSTKQYYILLECEGQGLSNESKRNGNICTCDDLTPPEAKIHGGTNDQDHTQYGGAVLVIVPTLSEPLLHAVRTKSKDAARIRDG